MHFTGRTWRPPYESNSCILELTAGCTYGKCRFCSLYHEEPFRLTPVETFEEDLREIKRLQPYARRVFLTGGNPFALPFSRLEGYIGAVRDHLIPPPKRKWPRTGKVSKASDRKFWDAPTNFPTAVVRCGY